jgi:hypothetical protein
MQNLLHLYGAMGEEAREDLWAALEDFHWLRGFLRRVGPEERARFDEGNWAWGDPSFYGHDPTEGMEIQLTAVLRTLGWERVHGSLYFQYVEDPESMAADEEGPFASLVDGRGAAPDLSLAPGWCEELMVVELAGPRHDVLHLASHLRLAARARERERARQPKKRPACGPFDGAIERTVYRWRPGSEWAKERPGSAEDGTAVALVVYPEHGGWRWFFQHEFCEWLFEAWEVRRGGKRGAGEGAEDGGPLAAGRRSGAGWLSGAVAGASRRAVRRARPQAPLVAARHRGRRTRARKRKGHLLP